MLTQQVPGSSAPRRLEAEPGLIMGEPPALAQCRAGALAWGPRTAQNGGRCPGQRIFPNHALQDIKKYHLY